MTDLIFPFKYTTICGEDPISECNHDATIKIITEGDIKEGEIKSALEIALEDTVMSISESKSGVEYELGSLKEEEFMDDISKLVKIHLNRELKIELKKND